MNYFQNSHQGMSQGSLGYPRMAYYWTKTIFKLKKNFIIYKYVL
jgi:hypothetical protein